MFLHTSTYLKILTSPINRHLSVFDKIIITEREVMIAKEAVIGGEGRGVGRAEDKVTRAVDYLSFLLRVTAPKDKDKVITLRREVANNGIGKRLPTMTCV